MKMQSALHRTLQALLITGISIFVLAPAFAADPVKVTAANYVRAELDFQMIGYKDVHVNTFWSVTLYDDRGWMPVNKYNTYSFNNVTAKKNEDGSITINFGGDSKQPNFRPIVPAGGTSCGCISRGKRSWMGVGNFQMRQPLSELWMSATIQIRRRNYEHREKHTFKTLSESRQKVRTGPGHPDPNGGEIRGARGHYAL